MKKLYRVTVKPETFGKPIEIYAEEVDLSFSPWVVIRGITLPVKSSIIHIENEAYEKFKDTKSLTLPYTGLCLCEELNERASMEAAQVLSALRPV